MLLLTKLLYLVFENVAGSDSDAPATLQKKKKEQQDLKY